MTPINYSFLLFLSPFVFLSSPTPFIDAAKEQQPLDIARGETKKNIFLEIGRNETCGPDQGWLLMCYPSKMLNHHGTAKASRRFQLMDQGSKNFASCRNLPNGPHSGLLIHFKGQELSIETSFDDMSFSCPMEEGNKWFGIQLAGGDSLFSSLRGCAAQSPCETVKKLGECFNESVQEAMVPYVDDFGPLWYLGIDMLESSNTPKKDHVTYFWEKCPWTVNFANVSTSLTCGEKVPMTTVTTTPTSTSSVPTTKPSTTAKLTTMTTKKPLNRTHLVKLNITKPGHKFRFGTDIGELACNNTQIKEEQEKYKLGLPKNVPASKKELNELKNKGCFNVDKPKGGDCHQWNSASMTVCYDGLLDPWQSVGKEFQLRNVPGNEIAAFCRQHQPKDRADVVRHGFTVGVCSRTVEYKQTENGTRFEAKYKVIFNVSLSYSEESLYYTNEAWVTGIIKPNGFHKADYPKMSHQALTIHIANGTSLFANLVDPTGKVHPFAENIQEMLDKKNYMVKFEEIAKWKDSLGLLGGDLIPQDGNDTSWNRELQFFQPPEFCGEMLLRIDDEFMSTRLNCYQRSRNYCDRVGKERFDEEIEKNHKLRWLQKNCACNASENNVTVPPEVLNRTPHPDAVSRSRTPWVPDRRKRSLNAKKSAKDLIPGCEDAEQRMEAFLMHGFINMKYLPELDKAIEEQNKCCPNGTNIGTDTNTNHGRGKRQLDRAVKLWKTPIAYRFAPDSQIRMFVDNVDYWKESIDEALRHIESLTCLKYYENDTVDEDSPHILFRSHPDVCRVDAIGFDKNLPGINYAEWCFDDKNRGTGPHEVLHTLGIHHEQLRKDRDDYVWIDRNRYEKQNTEQRDLPYDFGSVMHYGDPAIIPRDIAYQQSIRREGGLSFKDAKLVNLVYCTSKYRYHFDDPSVTRCEIGTEKWKSCENGGYSDPLQNCEKCRCPRGYDGEECTDLEESDKECGTEMELTAIPKWKDLDFNASQAKKAEKCIWRIRKNMNRNDLLKTSIVIEFVSLGFECAEPCDEWLEVKHTTDKTANGAHICCNFSLKYAEQMPKVTAQDYATEVLLVLHNPKKRGTFKIKYKTELPPPESSTECQNGIGLMAGPDRGSKFLTGCVNAGPNAISVKACQRQHFSVNSNEFKNCMKGAPTRLFVCSGFSGDIGFLCKSDHDMQVNGVTIQRARDCTAPEMVFYQAYSQYEDCKGCKDDPICSELTVIYCLKPENEKAQFYWKNGDGDMIRVSEIACRPREGV